MFLLKCTSLKIQWNTLKSIHFSGETTCLTEITDTVWNSPEQPIVALYYNSFSKKTLHFKYHLVTLILGKLFFPQH